MNYDNLLIDIFFPKNITKFSSKQYKKFIKYNDRYKNISLYLFNRFSFFNSYKESLFRIKYNIKEIPKCPICGKELQITFKPKNLYRKYCSYECSNNDIEKIENYKKFCLEKYGVKSTGQLQWVRQKAQKTFGSTTSQNKRNNTLRLNNSFNKSKPEEESYLLLKEKFPDIIRQYRSDLYPFNCDFYIPSKDLYIECNYTWTHGRKPYEGTEEDNIKLNKWKKKNTKYYNNAIQTWTIRDINKMNIAKKNNLNYKVFYNINDLKEYIK